MGAKWETKWSLTASGDVGSISSTQMCYLCFKENPFGFEGNLTDLSKKKKRASDIKLMLHALRTMDVCNEGQEEVEKLKAEQYQLSRDI